MRQVQKKPFTQQVNNKDMIAKHSIIMDQATTDTYKITIRLSVFLLDTLKNIIISNKTGGDFKYTSVSDLIRKSLDSYKNGMTLMTQRTKDQKKETSFRVSKELKDFYYTLPQNAKSEIIERAISTYIKHKL